MTVVRDRKILPAPGTNQIAGFGGHRPLAHWEKNKNHYFSPWCSCSLRVHKIKPRNIRLLFRISASHIDHRSFVDRCHNNIFISFFSGLKVKESCHWRLAKFKLLILSWYLNPCMAIWRQGFLLSLLTGRGKYLPPSCLQSEKQHCDCLKRSLSSCFMSSLQNLVHLFF